MEINSLGFSRSKFGEIIFFLLLLTDENVLFYQCNSILGVCYDRIHASFLQEWSKVISPGTWSIMSYIWHFPSLTGSTGDAFLQKCGGAFGFRSASVAITSACAEAKCIYTWCLPREHLFYHHPRGQGSKG